MKVLSRLKAGVAMTAIVAQLAVTAGPASAFCGFYVAKADAKMFNKSSKVVLARHGQETAITMASDYEGEPKEFAVVIPVPTFIERKQIGVVETKTIDHLDAYTAPRLVEYHDEDPCYPVMALRRAENFATASPAPSSVPRIALYKGVTVEATYDVGEYEGQMRDYGYAAVAASQAAEAEAGARHNRLMFWLYRRMTGARA